MCTIIMVNLKTISFVLFFFGMDWLCSLSLSFSRKAGHVSQDGVPKLTTGWEIEMDSKEFKISFCTPFLHHTFCLLHKIRLIRFTCNYFHRNLKKKKTISLVIHMRRSKKIPGRSWGIFKGGVRFEAYFR